MFGVQCPKKSRPIIAGPISFIPSREKRCKQSRKIVGIGSLLLLDGKCKSFLKILVATPQHNRNHSNFSRLSIFNTSIHPCRKNNRNIKFLIEVMGSENILWLYNTSWIGRVHFPNLVCSANNCRDRHDLPHFVDSARPLNADPYFRAHSAKGGGKMLIVMLRRS